MSHCQVERNLDANNNFHQNMPIPFAELENTFVEATMCVIQKHKEKKKKKKKRETKN